MRSTTTSTAGRGPVALWAAPGTGKTTLAMLVSKDRARGRALGRDLLAPKLLSRIRRTYDAEAGEQSYADLFERLATVDLLHIDDLGAENRSDWVLEQLYSIVNERYESQRSLVVTTNLDQPELEEQIGPRMVSRLVEICGDPLPLFDDDRRMPSRRTSPRRWAECGGLDRQRSSARSTTSAGGPSGRRSGPS